MVKALRTGGAYILLNGENGNFLQRKRQNSLHVITEGPDDSQGARNEEFIVDITNSDPLTITLTFGSGPDQLTLESSVDNSNVIIEPDGQGYDPQQWEVRELGSGIYSDFVKLINISTNTCLDLSNGTGSRVVGAKRSGNPSQLWNMILIPSSLTPSELRSRKAAEQQKFQQAKDAEKAQQLTNVPNSGGLGYIPTDEYNRIVRSWGYPGVR
ncbi:MAG: hypothetical protein M1813_002783 [Trichoglossum hirsutum]|nr:MAG: hypothetical protein M1813_002783 [Trichoglossum hirsutum]